MGRRKNNPSLVEELIGGLWSMGQEEFDNKYFSLSSSDQFKVSEAIDHMGEDCFSDDYEEDCSEGLSLNDARNIWLSNGCDEDYTFGYSEDELRKK